MYHMVALQNEFWTVQRKEISLFCENIGEPHTIFCFHTPYIVWQAYFV